MPRPFAAAAAAAVAVAASLSGAEQTGRVQQGEQLRKRGKGH